MRLPKHPLIYEINTWAWLAEVSGNGRPLHLDAVPGRVWDELASLGMDAVWLMGVWERSPRGREIALANPDLLAEFRGVLPDFAPTDVVGSAYCVRDYRVDAALGGDAALALARAELARRGVGLILDFVPNHTALDHPWVAQRPDMFVRGGEADLAREPGAFARAGQVIMAHGRDPFFPPWSDVAQLNAFSAAWRTEAAAVLGRLAGMADGLRCDMAMLLLHDVFERTWGPLAGPRPDGEFWAEVIPLARAVNPDVLFIAEAYWDTEYALQKLGFDYCYDKRLYDRLRHAASLGSGATARDHLAGEPAFEERLLRFMENHDEPRAASAFPADLLRLALVLTLAAPGARLLHDGQLDGRRTRLPVYLGRRPEEPVDTALRDFHLRLLAQHGPVFRRGGWRLCPTSGWPDNTSHQSLAAFAWELGEDRRLVVANLSATASQGLVHTGWDGLGGECNLLDPIQGQSFARSAADLGSLFVDLPGFGFHFLRLER